MHVTAIFGSQVLAKFKIEILAIFRAFTFCPPMVIRQDFKAGLLVSSCLEDLVVLRSFLNKMWGLWCTFFTKGGANNNQDGDNIALVAARRVKSQDDGISSRPAQRDLIGKLVIFDRHDSIFSRDERNSTSSKDVQAEDQFVQAWYECKTGM